MNGEAYTGKEGPQLNLPEYELMNRIEENYWWFVGRRAVIHFFLDHLHLNQEKILDVGCGTGCNLGLLRRYGSPIGLDISQEALRFCQNKSQKHLVQSGQEGDLPFRSESFSLVTVLDVLEHIEEDQKFLIEIRRVCKPGGLLLLTVPANRLLWSSHDVALHHYHRYSRDEIKNKMIGAGFLPLKIHPYNFYLMFPAILARIVRKLYVKEEKSDFFLPLPSIINKALAKIFSSEAAMAFHSGYPFGLSLICLAKKGKFLGQV